jgi:flagellar basal-body rod protein FlgG
MGIISAAEAFKSGMIAMSQKVRVIANNMSNLQTTGFRAQEAEFQDVMYQTETASGSQTGTAATDQAPQSSQIGFGVQFTGTRTNFKQGAPSPTGNPLNLALMGDPGTFFQVEKDGQTVYTRDGSFKLSSAGLLVTTDGYPVLPNITIPAGAQVSISETGVVTAKVPGQDTPQQLGQLQVAMFANPGALTRIGKNLFQGGGAAAAPVVGSPGASGAATVLSGYLEASNAEIVDGMIGLMEAQRAYEMNAKGIHTVDAMAGTVTKGG